MSGRNQFTFYRSFWEAVRGLERKDQLPVLSAVIEYALDGKEPANLTKTQTAFFLLTRPTLDASRRKAENGKQGGSKTKANGKQPGSKKENKKENEKENEDKKENEIEGENDKEHPLSNDLFHLFWDRYPAIGRGDRGEALAAWEALGLDEHGMRDILRKLDAWKASKRWTDDGGAYVPNIRNFLDRKRAYIHTAPAGNGIPCMTLGEAELGAIRRILDDDEREAIWRMMGEEGAGGPV